MTPSCGHLHLLGRGFGHCLCILSYVAVCKLRVLLHGRQTLDNGRHPGKAPLGADLSIVAMTSRYLLIFLVLAISLELLDLIFRGYTAVKSWDILRSVIYEKDFFKIFILQYGLGNLAPFILLTLRASRSAVPWPVLCWFSSGFS